MSIKGVIVGAIVDIVATDLRDVLLTIYDALPHDRDPMTDAQWAAIVQGMLQASPGLHTAWLLWGVLCSILGGYVAARIAGRDELLNGALASFLCVGGAAYALLHGPVAAPPWHYALDIAASPALGALGGYIRLATRARAVA